MKELDRTLEQDRKLKEFMAKKISDRHVDVSKVAELKPLSKINVNHFSERSSKYCQDFFQ